jgi:chromosome segregation ATPase
MTLQNHLDALEKNNETLKAILSESNEDLTIALDALMKSQNELATLKAQLQQAKNDAESAKNSLAIANQELAKASESFKQYEKERDKTENRLRNQRNIWEVLCLVAVGVAVAR